MPLAKALRKCESTGVFQVRKKVQGKRFGKSHHGVNSLSYFPVVSQVYFNNCTLYCKWKLTMETKGFVVRQSAKDIKLWEQTQDILDGNSLLKATCIAVEIIF